jgi:signal peptidase I
MTDPMKDTEAANTVRDGSQPGVLVDAADTQAEEQVKTEASLSEKKPKKVKKEKKKRTVWQEILSWVGTLLLAVVIAMTIRALLFEPIRVDGESMLETLQDGEIVLVTKPAVLLGRLNRGDVVICRYPNRSKTMGIHLGAPLDIQFVQHELFVKRLVGLPGDSIAVMNGLLYVNDSLVKEDYIDYPPVTDFPRITLGEDEYMVMGDNRRSSHDSRSRDVGPISRDMIVGKASFVLLPLSKMRPIN